MGYEDYDVGFASPTLTAMAQDGIIINNFYGQEVCTPARLASSSSLVLSCYYYHYHYHHFHHH